MYGCGSITTSRLNKRLPAIERKYNKRPGRFKIRTYECGSITTSRLNKQLPAIERKYNKRPGRLTNLRQNSGCDRCTPDPHPHL